MSTHSKMLAKDFTEGNVTKQMLLFAMPLFMSSFLQIVYNIVDMIIVGQMTGKIGLSAIAIGGDVTHFFTFIAIGFGGAAQIIVAQYLGAKQTDKLNLFVKTALTFMLLTTIAISAFSLTFKNGLLRLMNTPEESFQDALAYVSVSLSGLIFVYGYNFISAIMRGMGDSKHPFIFISVSAILNVLLDILFVIYMEMGAVGAAWGTVISQGVSFILSVVFLWRHQRHFYLELDITTFFRIDKEMLLALIKLGIPMAVKGMAIHFSKLFMNSWINSYGVAVSAMVGIGHKLGMISILFSSSFNTAGSSMIGQNIGAEKYERVPVIMNATFVLTLITSIILSVAVVGFPGKVFGAFTSDKEVLSVANEFIPIAVLTFLGSAFRAPMNGLIDGSGNYKLNFLVALFDGFVMRIGLAVLFCIGFNQGYMGLWFGDAIAGFTPFVIGVVYYYSGTWRTRSYLFKD